MKMLISSLGIMGKSPLMFRTFNASTAIKHFFQLGSIFLAAFFIVACADASKSSTSNNASTSTDTTNSVTIYTVTLDPSPGVFNNDKLLKREAGTTLGNNSGTKNSGSFSDYTLPTRVGYYFTGWYDSSSPDGGTIYTESTVIKKDVTLYAHWYEQPATTPAKICTVTLDPAQGTFTGSTTLKRQSGATLGDNFGTNSTGAFSSDANPTRYNYVFAGWYDTQNTDGTKYDSTSVINNDITLYARWNPIYTVTLDPSPGTLSSYTTLSTTLKREAGTRMDDNYLPQSVGNYTDSVKPTRTGYVFLGWFDAQTGGKPYYFNTIVNSNVTLYAHWYQPTMYTVTLNPTQGSLSSGYSSILKRESGSTLSDNQGTNNMNSGVYGLFGDPAERTGYAFAGWFDDITSGTEYYQNSVITKDVTLFARWKPVFVIMIDPSPGKFDPNASPAIATTLNRESGATLGVTIDSYTHSKNTGIFSDTNKPSYTRAIVHNINTGDVDYLPYIFLGWYDAPTGGTKYDASSVILKDLNLYAHWNPSYLVTLDPSPGSFVNEKKIYRESGTSLGNNNGYFSSHYSDNYLPTRTGYTFLGWYDALSGGTKYDANTVISKDVTLYAHWQ